MVLLFCLTFRAKVGSNLFGEVLEVCGRWPMNRAFNLRMQNTISTVLGDEGIVLKRNSQVVQWFERVDHEGVAEALSLFIFSRV